jgi:ribose/xylose/arabinose/galactoside ABC-type transport system permease subunit
VKRIRVVLFAVAGVLAGISGVLLTAFAGDLSLTDGMRPQS